MNGRGRRAAIASLALVAVILTGVSAAAQPAAEKPKWLVIPSFWPADAGVALLGSASGRGWIGLARGNGDSRSTLLGSLHGVGGKLSFAKSVLPRSQPPMMILGSSLVYHSSDPSGEPGELRTAPLLANGGVGTPKVVPDDPESIPPQQYNPLVADGIQVGDRLVWVLTGSKPRLSPVLDFIWACCTSGGELSDLSRFIDHRRDGYGFQLGRDAKGRLWLVWLDAQVRKVWGAVRMVELDPDTLAPRTSKTFVAPAPDSWIRPELVCGDRCRVVIEDLGGDIFTWAPGERSATRMYLGTRENHATLLDASYRSDSLIVASEKSRQLHSPPWNVSEISLVRGDSRGSHSRPAGLVAPAPFGGSSPFQWQPPVHATLVPGGLVFFKNYVNFREPNRSRVLAGFLPLTR